MVLHVGDPHDEMAQQPPETLQVGPARPSWFEKVPTKWRQRAVPLLVFVLGVAAGGGAVLWSTDRTSPSPFRPDEHAVELMLFKAEPPRAEARGRGLEFSPLHVAGAVLLSGAITSTVLRIHPPDPSLEVRAPALPVTISPTARLQLVNLRIIVRDCKAATRWAPDDRAFTITWRDEFGREHVDRAGDFEKSMAISLVRYVDAVCDE
jgi:hypothetical protein